MEGKFLLKLFIEGKYDQSGAKIEFKRIEKNDNPKVPKPGKKDTKNQDNDQNRNPDGNDINNNRKNDRDRNRNRDQEQEQEQGGDFNLDQDREFESDEKRITDDGAIGEEAWAEEEEEEVVEEEEEEETETPQKPIRGRERKFNYTDTRLDDVGEVVSRACLIM